MKRDKAIKWDHVTTIDEHDLKEMITKLETEAQDVFYDFTFGDDSVTVYWNDRK